MLLVELGKMVESSVESKDNLLSCIVLFLTLSIFNATADVYPSGRNVKSGSQIYNPQLPQVNTHIYHHGLIMLAGKTTALSYISAAPEVMIATIYM